MADIPSNLDKMNDIEISTDAPITESLMNKFGANINGLIDLAGFDFEEFLANGTFNVPEGITRVLLFGYGGGGGGAQGLVAGNLGGPGGGGAEVIMTTVEVTPGDAIAVTIGTGGTSQVDGNNTTFGSLATFRGGRCSVHAGGDVGIAGGNGGNTFFRNSTPTNSTQVAYASPGGNQLGQGGTAGNNSGSRGGGAGGGGSFGAGGNGGNASTSSDGDNAAANSGGGGGGGASATPSATTGGTGGSGRLWVIW